MNGHIPHFKSSTFTSNLFHIIEWYIMYSTSSITVSNILPIFTDNQIIISSTYWARTLHSHLYSGQIFEEVRSSLERQLVPTLDRERWWADAARSCKGRDDWDSGQDFDAQGCAEWMCRMGWSCMSYIDTCDMFVFPNKGFHGSPSHWCFLLVPRPKQRWKSKDWLQLCRGFTGDVMILSTGEDAN